MCEGEKESVCVRERKRGRESVCEGEGESVCVREGERVFV